MNNPFQTIDARLSNIETLLLDLKHTQKEQDEQPTETDRWFDLNELCIYHPDKPSKPTVYGWVHSGLIPVHKGSKKLRFLKSEIDSWIKQGRKKTNAEISIEAEQYLTKKGLKL